EQMKMFLTRLGFGSRMVVTGDITQVDLPREQQSGLIVGGGGLQEIEGVDWGPATSARRSGGSSSCAPAPRTSSATSSCSGSSRPTTYTQSARPQSSAPPIAAPDRR